MTDGVLRAPAAPAATAPAADGPEAQAGAREGRLALRILVLIRWIAIAGQLTAVLTVHFGLGFALPLGPALATIGASILLNVAAQVQRGNRARVTDRDAALYLGFDTLQLTLLLYLTGGLQNPFAILILAPLTVAATVLSRINVIGLTALGLACISGLAIWRYPLPWPEGQLVLPPLYSIGIWMALSLSAIFITAYVWSVAQEVRRMSEALVASQMALAREQKLSALGALAAAAAHELGTPLGTIAVVAKELAREVPPDSPLAEDITLLQSESERCRKILAELARKPEAEGGQPYDLLPLRTMIETAAAPHQVPGIRLDIDIDDRNWPHGQPMMRRSPEVLHGLGNLIQNAMQFARHRVHVQAYADAQGCVVTVTDDGPGFPPHLLNRIGEPYVSYRQGTGSHMGLGIFIAQTLLQRTGATVSFGNSRGGGAQVVVRWNQSILEAAGMGQEMP